MYKIYQLGIAGVAIGMILIASFFITNKTDASGWYTGPALTATTASIITVGPDTNVQISATSSRSYLLVERDNSVAAVYCNANGDAYASTTVTGGVSFKLATTTGEKYEFDLDTNSYDGAVRCTATASTTLIVFELKRN